MEKSHLITLLFLSCHFFYHSLTHHWVCNCTVQNITLSYLWNSAFFLWTHSFFCFCFSVSTRCAALLSVQQLMSLSYWNRDALVVCFTLYVSDMHLCVCMLALWKIERPSVLEDWNPQCGYYTNWWLVLWKALQGELQSAHFTYWSCLYIGCTLDQIRQSASCKVKRNFG